MTLLPTLILGLGLVLANTFAIAMLPRSQGFTVLAPTLASALGFLLTAWCLARLIHSGVQLSLLMPLLAGIIPMAAIAVGVLLFGEDISWLKLGLLGSACVLIGMASYF